ncbi:hypothetical protein VTH82DRAFT_7703 [Thermothelomyces myriococcoides]
MGWTAFLLTYLLGGITFIPLVVVIVFLHAYFILPRRHDGDASNDSTGNDDLIQPGDDIEPLKAAQREGIKNRASYHDQDVAAGYFAVCREYTPMGINAKPIERATPVGSATVAAPSPSVYQTMYRSIFDRKQTPSPLDSKNIGSQRPKKAGNVFYVVLRHGHLMLFDDDEQLEVRHVVSLAHHDVSIYSGEPVTPEGELWIKRNAICLTRRRDGPDMGPDTQVSKPFFLFSENCSAKEDFYFALLRNQEQTVTAGNRAPTPIQFDVKNIISLVQKLHSSEEHLQTRWLNAMIGRLFLGVHKTKDIENFIREKLTKKISRVKRPAFLSNITIKAIDTGDSAPYITNPRLKDLTVEGECGMEADVRYTGNFRLEVAATARLDLGSRFTREVNLVLAVVLRKLEGHALLKIKPPPSNRIWFAFQQMPKIEMTIEPIVSSRQITYTVILRQIENRIKEVIAETIVLPYWDDTPFFSTEHKKWRGGIFHDDTVKPATGPESAAAQEGDLGEVERLEETRGAQEDHPPPIEKSHSEPVLEKKSSSNGLFGRKPSVKASKPDMTPSPSTSSASIELSKSEAKGDISSPPPVLSAPFAQPSSPTVGTIATNADHFRPSSSPPSGDSALAAIATLSATPPSAPSPAQNPSNANQFKPYITSKSPNLSSSSSRDATDSEKDAVKTPQARRNTASSTGSQSDNGSHSPAPSSKDPVRSRAGSISRSLFSRPDTTTSISSGTSSQSANESHKRSALNVVANAAASAKRWGFNAFQRRGNDDAAGANHGNSGESASVVDLSQPMGRGQPLPPPGTPLPMPERKTSMAAMQVFKRKPINAAPTDRNSEPSNDRRPVPPPPLPKRRQPQPEQDGENNGMLVVTAPADSEPTTPLSATYKPSDGPRMQGEVAGDPAPLSSGSDDTTRAPVGLGVSSASDATERETERLDGATRMPDYADDEDYSAWMIDDPESGEVDAPPASSRAA